MRPGGLGRSGARSPAADWGAAGPATSRRGGYFGFRGIVEGFYGQRYTHVDRVDLLRFEAAHGMNIFVDPPRKTPT